jgi:hypothetical protein
LLPELYQKYRKVAKLMHPADRERLAVLALGIVGQFSPGGLTANQKPLKKLVVNLPARLMGRGVKGISLLRLEFPSRWQKLAKTISS